MKKTIYKIIILIGLTLFVYFMFTYFQNIYYFNKQKCECQKNEIYIGSKSFSFNGVLGTNLENAKALVFKKGSNFKIVIDSTNLKLLETEVKWVYKKAGFFMSAT